MKTKFYIILFMFFCLLTSNLFAQSILTFNYASSGLSTTACNVFYPPVSVQGHTHTSVAWAPGFNGKIALDVAYSSVLSNSLGTAYGINYNFISGHGYTIGTSMNYTTDNPSQPQPRFYVGVSTSLPSVSNICVVTGQGVYFTPFTSIYSTPINASGTNVQVPSFTGSGQSYLLLGAYPDGYITQSFSDFVYITTVSIVDLAPITGSNNVVCSGLPQSYSVSAAYPVTWSASPSGAVTLSPSGTNNQNCSASLASGNGTVTLSATVASPYGNVTVSKQITVGAAPVPYISNIQLVPAPYYGIEGTVVTNTLAPYYWYIDGVQKKTTNQTFSDVVVVGQCGALQHSFQVGVSNGCGAQTKSSAYFFSIPCSNTAFSVSPNPSNGKVHVGLISDPNQSNAQSFDAIKVYNGYGELIKEYRYSKAVQADLILDNHLAGNYFIEIHSGKYVEKKHILLKK